jgi:hypothetical protein
MAATILQTVGVLTPILLMQAQDARTLETYQQAIHAFVEIHRTAEASLPPARPCGSAERIAERREALAQAIRRKRGVVGEGAIFTPAVAGLFRARLAIALGELGMEAYDLVRLLPAEPPVPLIVGELLPWEVDPHRWSVLLWALPPIPEELAYRIVGNDLALVDIEARIVVDVLRGAIQHVPDAGPRH